MRLSAASFAQKLTRTKKKDIVPNHLILYRSGEIEPACHVFPKLYCYCTFFYDLAEVAQTFSLSWLIYTHVVAINMEEEKNHTYSIAEKLGGNWQRHMERKAQCEQVGKKRLFARVSQSKLTSSPIKFRCFVWGQKSWSFFILLISFTIGHKYLSWSQLKGCNLAHPLTC